MVPPALILIAVLIWASGVFDRPGFEGVGEGFALGAAVATPLWLLRLRRGSASSDRGD